MLPLPQMLSLRPLLKKVLIAELLLGFLLLANTCKCQSLETNQPQLVTATVGEDVVLPCHLGVAVNVDELVVEWGRLDLSPKFVNVWFEGSEYTDDLNTAYRGRTSLFTDRLRDGDVSLRLTGVRLSDNARFRCYYPKGNKEYFINLLVGSVSSPAVSLAGLDPSISGVMLDCSSAGWYPEPEVFWLDGEGIIISIGPSEKTRGPDGLYTVSSRVTVEKRHNNNITCRVQQKDINQIRETHFYVQGRKRASLLSSNTLVIVLTVLFCWVSDDFFMAQSGCSVHITFIVIFVVMLIFGVFLLIWIKKQNKNKMKKLEEKVNEEQQLMKEEKPNLAEKKSNLEEEIKKRNEDQRSIDQEIEALMKMSEELKEQKKRLTDQRVEAEKMVEENDKKLKAVVEEVEKQKEYKTEKRAQGYLKLKQIMTESNETLEKRKKTHQKMELMTEKLMRSVSSPAVSLAGLDPSISGVMLDCSSTGWFSEPEIFWLDAEGTMIFIGPSEKTRGPDGLYTVSSRVTVEKRHNNNVTCRVQQKDINQTRETHFYVQDDFFMAQSAVIGPPTTPPLLGPLMDSTCPPNGRSATYCHFGSSLTGSLEPVLASFPQRCLLWVIHAVNPC
ncbi:uncharacterized protein V3H82_013297 [Fundulus diaphanus]